MSLYTVARDDFTNAVKSSLVLSVVAGFSLVTLFIFGSEISVYDNPTRTLWDVQQAVILIEPLLLLGLCYRAVVGDRTSGRIKYILGLPNSRTEYYVGTVLSRTALVVLAVVVSVAVGYLVAAVAFVTPPNPVHFLLFGGATVLYLLVFAGLFLAVSASVDSRPAAMLGCIGAYFLLVPFVLGVAPYMNLDTAMRATGKVVGVGVSEDMVNTVKSLTPYPAYGGVAEVVFGNITDQYDNIPQPDASDKTALHARLWFDMAVLVVWGTVSIGLGLLTFDRKEIN